MLKVYILILFFFVQGVNSHSGGLNSEGCHNDKSNSVYHCHKYSSDRRDDGFRIVDGDTIHFNFDKIKVRFSGIDTPEIGQICYGKNGPFDCGITAKEKLKRLIGDNLPTCLSEGEDKYGRILAECFVQEKSISMYLVREGYAFAYEKYSTKFIKHENYAKKNKLGLWQTKFEYPWEYRKN